MKRLALLAALFASPLLAQSAAVPDLTTAENATDRAVSWCKKNNPAKCLENTLVAEAAIDRALAILAPAPTPSPTPTPPPHHEEPPLTGWEPTPSLAGKPPIPSTFDPALGMHPSWGTGAIAVSASPDPIGAFRMTCGAGDLAYIDPIVYPGTVGVSHLHQFYGLTDVRPNETYESARSAGRHSTCGTGEAALNKSMYWLPALLDGKGSVIQPNLISIYYKRRPKSDPLCNWNTSARGQAEECLDIPQGLKMLSGFDMLDPVGSAARTTQAVHFYCSGNGAPATTADTLEAVLPNCPDGSKLIVSLAFPDCWDGKNLDSPNHRAHLAFGSYGSWGYLKCPATHPKLIPQVSLKAEYSLEAGDDRALLRLSSDVFPGVPRGKTLHGDVGIAWDPMAHRAFHDNCIDKVLNCSGGDLGNGWQLNGASQPSYGWTNPVRLVPVPTNGGG